MIRLFKSKALADLWSTGQTAKIDSMIESGGRAGMQTMDSHIQKLLESLQGMTGNIKPQGFFLQQEPLLFIPFGNIGKPCE